MAMQRGTGKVISKCPRADSCQASGPCPDRLALRPPGAGHPATVRYLQRRHCVLRRRSSAITRREQDQQVAGFPIADFARGPLIAFSPQPAHRMPGSVRLCRICLGAGPAGGGWQRLCGRDRAPFRTARWSLPEPGVAECPSPPGWRLRRGDVDLLVVAGQIGGTGTTSVTGSPARRRRRSAGKAGTAPLA